MINTGSGDNSPFPPRIGTIIERDGKRYRVVEIVVYPNPVVTQPPGCFPGSVVGEIYVEEIPGQS